MPLARLTLITVFALFFVLCPVSAQTNAESAVQAVRGFYQAVDAQQYAQAWALLTEASKSRIATMVAEEAKLPVEDVRQLFDSTAPEISEGFWVSFREGEQVQMVLSLDLEYSGVKEDFHVLLASMPADKGGNGESMEFLVKDEGGPKFGIAETFNF